MPPDTAVANITRVIQLSVAPVFLLTAAGTLLGVFSTRLGRIVDRSRKLLERLPEVPPDRQAGVREELALQFRRRRLVNTSIGFATAAALLVCVLIAVAFIASLLHWDFSHPVAGLFVAAMVAFIGALLAFLAEVLLAVRSVRIDH